MSNMLIRTKLIIAFGGLALLVTAISILAIVTLSQANQRFEDFVAGINARLMTAHKLQEAVELRAISARNLVLVTKPGDQEGEKATVIAAQGEVVKQLARLNALVATDTNVSDEVKRMVVEIDRIERAYSPVAAAIVDLALNNQTDLAIAKMNDECRPLLAALIKATNAFNSYSEERAEDLMVQSAQEFANQRNSVFAGCILALLLALVAGWVLTSAITRPITRAVTVAEAIATGDLTSQFNSHSGDEMGRLLRAMERMQEGLQKVVSDVRSSSEMVASASNEIAQGNHDLSGRTESQASALEETAASMEELSAAVRQNADTAAQVNQLAQSAARVAVQGGDAVSQVIQTMKGINESSSRIADIIGVIDSIAFQTNILALNAAVEAARAGEQGRGFAVVATEVRSLAGRTAGAAKEIKDLIGASVQRVTEGSSQVDHAGQTMAEVVSAIQRVTDLMGEITSASNEQAAGVVQVGEAIMQMDHTTQQNAALVEEMAAAAGGLRNQAAELVQVVAAFRLPTGRVVRGSVTLEPSKSSFELPRLTTDKLSLMGDS